MQVSSKMVLGGGICDKVFLGNGLWENARKALNQEKDKVIPVFNHNMEMICFARNEHHLEEKWTKLCEIRERIDRDLFRNLRHRENAVHLKGISDVLYDIRLWLQSIGIEVTVEGEGLWEEVFGIVETECCDGDRLIIDEECQWLDHLYEEYWNWLENYSRKLKKMLCMPYEPDRLKVEKKEKIIFYLPWAFACVESITPLLFYYLQSGKECICVIISIKYLMRLGCNNVDYVTETIEKWKMAGVTCCMADEQGLLSNEYKICFYLSEYSGSVPSELRKRSRWVIALQTTAIYTHMYMTGKFEAVFSEYQREEMDYLIASDYVADWICEHDKKWEEKILRFGYPKLDTLYVTLKGELQIPYKWRSRISGRKVYLFTTYDMEKLWLDFFLDKEDQKIAIWRPHPNFLADVKERKRMEEISRQYNVIIDDTPTYYAAFRISDALITSAQSSVMINYLCTNKPVCLYCDNYMDMAEWTMNYQNEIWYKSAFSALEEKDVLDFIRKMEAGEKIINDQQMMYRKYITSNFDGKVCRRIYDYFEQNS